MRADILKVNQLIDIEIDNSDMIRERYPSRVEEIRKSHVIVSMPMKHGVLMPLQTGQEVSIVISGKSGFFAGRTRIVSRERNPIPVLVLDMPEELVKADQRRNYVRLGIALPVEFSLNDTNREPQVEKGTTSDISGGGVSIISTVNLDLGDNIDLRLFLGKEDIIECRAEVIRTQRDPVKSRIFWAGVKFLDISEKQRDRIFNFIFSKQREWIQKGLI